jgi:predicted extracellular nuclease
MLFLLVSALSISEIQGPSLVSPFVADSVSTTGVVTMKLRDGFLLQDPSGDGDDATSDALFVRSAANVLLRDEVHVVGVVDEFLPAGNSSYLTTTEVVASRVERLRASLSLPPAVCIARDTRFPGANGVSFWESLEGMRVCVTAPRVVQSSFGDHVWMVPDDTDLSVRGALAVQPGDMNFERVKLVAAGMPRLVTGDMLSDVTGVLNYRAGNFELWLDAPPVKVSGSLAREISTLPAAAGRVRMAAFNLHNLGLEEPERIAEIGRIMVSQWGAPEILGLVEVVDDSGSQNDGMVDATLTLRALVDAIRAADGPPYDFREIPPADGTDGGAPGHNIRPVLLFDPARVEFVDRGDTSGSAGTRVVSKNGHPELTRSPGRIQPGNPAWVASRKPLACELRVDGSTLFVVVCHFVSKSRSSPLFGAVQPPTDPDAPKRRRQAELVADFVGDALSIDPDARVVVLGDLNDDWFSATIAALESAPLTSLWNQIPPRERYSYIFDGNAHTLDHVLVTPVLADGALFDVVHVGAEFPEGVSDHDAVMASVHIDRGEPVVAGFELSPAFPNPFTSAVRLTVTGESAAHRAVVFDVAGRLVTTLTVADGVMAWGGHDNAGRNVPAGVYFVRVSDGVSTRARKVVLIR